MTRFTFTWWLLASALFGTGCASTRRRRRQARAPRGRSVTVEATGYCKCGSCCGWKRNWLGRPVYTSGSLKGKPKEVGITASGTMAQPFHTIAADTDVYPFGTKMFVPGYGWGVVEDVGGAIKGERIDLFFPSHQDALEWGRKEVTIEVILP
ncbi:MAG: 3D domain-containing protein [Verrucomicrobiota bacterium]